MVGGTINKGAMAAQRLHNGQQWRATIIWDQASRAMQLKRGNPTTIIIIANIFIIITTITIYRQENNGTYMAEQLTWKIQKTMKNSFIIWTLPVYCLPNCFPSRKIHGEHVNIWTMNMVGDFLNFRWLTTWQRGRLDWYITALTENMIWVAKKYYHTKLTNPIDPYFW